MEPAARERDRDRLRDRELPLVIALVLVLPTGGDPRPATLACLGWYDTPLMSRPTPHDDSGRFWSIVQRHQVPLVLGLLLVVHTVVTALLLSINHPVVHIITDDFAHVAAVYHLWTSLEIGGLGAVPLFLRELNSHYRYLRLSIT